MKVLVVVCLCVTAVVGFPASTAKNTDADDTATSLAAASRPSAKPKREILAGGGWRPIYPRTTFRVFKVPATYEETSSSHDESNDIPTKTLSKFQAPSVVSQKDRLLLYYADSPELSVPPHAQQLLHKSPFFETLDHAKLITALQERRKYVGLPGHVLKSARPHFPFFSY